MFNLRTILYEICMLLLIISFIVFYILNTVSIFFSLHEPVILKLLMDRLL